MLFNDIDFPNQLVDALKEGKLVVFAGAGASMDKPTSLPNFRNLAKEIAKGTGAVLKEDDSCEVFLGALKANGVPVNDLAADKLSNSCVLHNKLHEAIVHLFPNQEDIKIVTTNYDKMFEKALEADHVQTRVCNAPMLPLGNDVHGIVHLHGIVDEPKYMVLTDEDFGRAYLTDGYAARFLVRLFESYSVLFIGYSYNDIILRYLTRAMSRQNIGKKYILTSDEKANWSALGISPIFFRNHDYNAMREALVKLGVLVKRGLLDWKNQLSAIANAPFNDITIDAEIDYCLEDLERTRIMADCIHDKEWINYLDGKRIFDGCFSETTSFTERDYLWANWLCENFLGKEDEALRILICNHNNVINKSFADIVIKKVLDLDKFGKEYSREYIVLCEKHLANPWIICRLVENSYKSGFYRLCLRLFMKLFDSNFVLKEHLLWGNSVEYEIAFRGEYYEIARAWESIRGRLSTELTYEIMNGVMQKIEEIHFDSKLLEMSSNSYNTWNMLSIEERNEIHKDDPLLVMSQMYADAACIMQKTDGNLLKSILLRSIHSEAVLLCKIGLRCIRLTAVFSPDEIVDIILDNNFLNELYVKEQVFLLVAKIFSELSNKGKDKLIDEIKKLGIKNDERNRIYEVYNWCVWIEKFDPENSRINKIKNEILAEHNFAPREHPELDIVVYPTVWMEDKSPVSEGEILNLKIKDVVSLLKDYREDPFKGPNRYGLLKVFSACVSKEYRWTKQIVLQLIEQQISEQDVWDHVLFGLNEAEFGLSDSIEILQILTNAMPLIKADKDIANYLWKIVKSVDCKNEFVSVEEKLFVISEKIWNKRSHEKPKVGRLIDLTMNTTVGIVIFTWIYMVSYTKNGCVPSRYREKFESSLRMRTWEREVAISVLTGHFDFLFAIDKKWSVKYILPFFNGRSEKTFASAWTGFVFLSGRINANSADVMASSFLQAIKHFSWIDKESKHGFVELLLTLLIHVINDPTVEYIPEFYKAATAEDLKCFVRAIESRLNSMDEASIESWWKQWLKVYLDNRKKNKPFRLTEEENQAIYELLPYMGPVFEEAVNVICQGEAPKNMDLFFWHTLQEKHLAKEHPHESAMIMGKLLSSGSVSYFEKDIIKLILKELTGLDEKEQKRLQEMLLKNDIKI